MRITLKECGSIKEAVKLIESLEMAFLDKFNRSTEVSFYAWSSGDPKVDPMHGITLEYDEKDSKEADFFIALVNNK